jgi:hypothetical protein
MHSIPIPRRPAPSQIRLGVLRAIGITIMWFTLALLTLWAVAALYVDFRIAALRIPVTLIYVLGIVMILVKFKRSRWAAALCLAGFCSVLAWWLTLKPSNEGNWQPDADRTAWAEMDRLSRRTGLGIWPRSPPNPDSRMGLCTPAHPAGPRCRFDARCLPLRRSWLRQPWALDAEGRMYRNRPLHVRLAPSDSAFHRQQRCSLLLRCSRNTVHIVF